MVKKTKSGNGFFKFLSLIRLKVNLEGRHKASVLHLGGLFLGIMGTQHGHCLLNLGGQCFP